jgi:hypothetical protein
MTESATLAKSAMKSALGMGATLLLIGSGWLLTVWDVVPGVNWIWIAALGLAGLVPVALGGFNKVTAFGAGLMIACSFASILRQRGHISVNVEVPALVVVAGLLMVLVTVLPIKPPPWGAIVQK